MGAWSAEPFGNDTAADWAWELDDSNNWDVVRAALDAALGAEGDGGGDMDADVATVAIAAADVVAQSLGRSLIDEVDDDIGDEEDDEEEDDDDVDDESVVAFLDRVGEPPADLAQLAMAALAAATGPASELTQLWVESGETEWTEVNAKIRVALGG